jgi:hypothetical protein
MVRALVLERGDVVERLERCDGAGHGWLAIDGVQGCWALDEEVGKKDTSRRFLA